jgi:hypothetical protein
LDNITYYRLIGKQCYEFLVHYFKF